MKCPHCNKTINEPLLYNNATTNCENYGSSSFVFKCKHCGKKYRVYLTRKVMMDKPVKAQDDADLSYG